MWDISDGEYKSRILSVVEQPLEFNSFCNDVFPGKFQAFNHGCGIIPAELQVDSFQSSICLLIELSRDWKSMSSQNALQLYIHGGFISFVMLSLNL